MRAARKPARDPQDASPSPPLAASAPRTHAGTTINLTVLTILQIVFLALKLAGAIDWRWLWILDPAWTSGLVIAAVWFAAVGRKRRR